MKTRTKPSPTPEELSGYIDIVPYQQKGDPCYGGDTGETEYEDYVRGTPELYKEKDNRLIAAEAKLKLLDP
jgi:hypothetical protein